MFTMRTTKPSNNKYYIRTVSGGYNNAIQGYPVDNSANVLANCVGYANGRFAEIQGLGYIKYQLTCNAENFIERAKELGLTISNKPTLGGIMVWQKGATLSGSDGAGHVAIVERIDNANQIYTSESGYGSTAFWNATRNNNNGRWGIGAGYTFRGCIVNPAVKDSIPVEPVPSAGVAESFSKVFAGAYKSKWNVNLRSGGSTKYPILTCVPAGTTVRCYGYFHTENKETWIYVAVTLNNKRYVGFMRKDLLYRV